MAQNSKEALGSMSDDAQPAYLTKNIRRPLSHFFKQRFAQVTNPPIDPIREKNITSLVTYIGSFNMLKSQDRPKALIKLDSPILLNNTFKALKDAIGKNGFAEIDTSFNINTSNKSALENKLREIQQQAIDISLQDKHIIISDRNINDSRAAIPILLATSAIHTHLIANNKRNQTSINVHCSEVSDTHDYATLIGMGADTVNAYLAEETIYDAYKNNELEVATINTALKNFKQSIEDGILKIMSKMGISDVNSYRGARLFEALGLSKKLMAEFFPGVSSAISGLGLEHLQNLIIKHHKSAIQSTELRYGGLIRNRKGQIPHAINSFKIKLLQDSVKEKNTIISYKLYKKYINYINHDAKQNPIYLRDLLELNKSNRTSIPVNQVKPAKDFFKFLVTGAMSMGSISKEAHETIALAMNIIGGKSNSGEGGEDPNRLWNNNSSAIKQIASGRFGVTTDYLAEAKEIQIKIAQGAKPGEGGQLMNSKVSVEIAKLRHCKPGTTLISPPPHHDIYSIEDLAQLIFDMKEVNINAKVSVKLVASEGVDIIAVGVAKAGADAIHISGGRGGTGASPQTSILHCGQEFEIALAKTHLALQAEGFRKKVKLTTDGSLRTGKDIIIAAMLGAEEFGFGLQALIAQGCQLARVCQNGTCPVGVATQDEELRKNFSGTTDDIIRMFTNIVEDIRENLAEIGAKSLEEIIGRTDLLKQVAGHELNINLSEIIPQMEKNYQPQYYTRKTRNEYYNPSKPDFISLDRVWIKEYQKEICTGQNYTISAKVTTQHRNIGTHISGYLSKHFKGIEKQTKQFLTLNLRGTVGQSLGAYTANGISINLEGAANDYVGKGLSGGSIVIYPDKTSIITKETQENIIIGNTCLYGATSGTLYAAGQAGNRFAIRLSGAQAIIEGAGDNACEYMTNGQVIILNDVGNNFGSGMSGGEAFIYDKNNKLLEHASNDIKNKIQSIEKNSELAQFLKKQIESHIAKTSSKHATKLLKNWDNTITHFKYIAPKNL